METLERFQQNQRVIEDFSARTLASIPSDFARLYYVSSLRETQNGKYNHEGLAALYPEGAVQHDLDHCHGELFCKVVEMPLERQEWDLRSCLGALDRDISRVVEHWGRPRTGLEMSPEGMPGYLKDLFDSNLKVLLEVIAKDAVSLSGAA